MVELFIRASLFVNSHLMTLFFCISLSNSVLVNAYLSDCKRDIWTFQYVKTNGVENKQRKFENLSNF